MGADSATIKRELFRDLGGKFYYWYKSEKVKFVYGTEGRALDTEIKRISRLIEYVKKKKGGVRQNSGEANGRGEKKTKT